MGNWVLLETKERTFLSPPQQPYFLFLSPPPPPPSHSTAFNLNNKVSPSMLLIIIFLAIIFFISGLLHLLVRFLLRPPNRDPDETDNLTALQGQLQQLFHLHDAGVDQSFIDTLPVFNYKAIIGVKDPFDCAVCLCEFEGDDNLRLLPKCSHAFHMDCIDTWLLSHSTCPICRASLLPDFSSNITHCSPVVLVLESGSESGRENESGFGPGPNPGSDDCGADQKSGEIEVTEEGSDERVKRLKEKVVTVKLGKFKNVERESGGSSERNPDARRCFSMGSFAYVMDEDLCLQVPIRTPVKKQASKKPSLPLTPGRRQAMSECGCDSAREFNGFEPFKVVCNNDDTKAIGGGKRESFSVSKIWLRGKNDEAMMSSRRAFSFRIPVHRNPVTSDETRGKRTRRTVSEMDMRWGSGGSEVGVEGGIGRCDSLDSEANATSFARRTLLWLMGKPNKVVHSSVFSSNV